MVSRIAETILDVREEENLAKCAKLPEMQLWGQIEGSVGKVEMVLRGKGQ